LWVGDQARGGLFRSFESELWSACGASADRSARKIGPESIAADRVVSPAPEQVIPSEQQGAEGDVGASSGDSPSCCPAGECPRPARSAVSAHAT